MREKQRDSEDPLRVEGDREGKGLGQRGERQEEEGWGQEGHSGASGRFPGHLMSWIPKINSDVGFSDGDLAQTEITIS